MTSFDRKDSLDRLLAGLPAASPDAGRSERVRARCATLLSLGAHRQPRPISRAGVVESVVVGGFCVVYFGAVIVDAMRVLLTY